ncbi:hypothetical protein [Paraferrimonas sedimenticola]|uniref:Uncharacterized protein n=1 Tax=Paraferrimonas sedimenticola TaxID=375674 RepID=A0AA37RVQ3_9GAMM|nr:hypothetical protein [Paraferrimonas sedimenticola]GLP96121.1 hypothetical protein GCM10007895_14270 [Paraferrimonas sedimenticola]
MKPMLLIMSLLLAATELQAANMPSPTMAQGDRIRVRGETGIELDATYAPKMTIQTGIMAGKDNGRERWHDCFNRRNRDEGMVYIQAVIPITFGDKPQADPTRLYDLELRARQAHIEKLEAEIELLRASAQAQQHSSFSE